MKPSHSPLSSPLLAPQRIVPAGLLLLGLLGAFLAGHWQRQDNQRVLIQESSQRMDQVLLRLRGRLDQHHQDLLDVRGLVLSNDDSLTRRQLRIYDESQGALKKIEEEGGVRALGYIRRVAAADVAAFVRDARREGPADFAIRQLGPNQGERYVIRYVEPEARNQMAVGLDVASEPRRKAAAEFAADTGQLVMTAPIALVQAPQLGERAALLLLPVYHPGLPTDSSAQRRQALSGWTYAPLRFDELMAHLGTDLNGLDFEVVDV